MLVQEVAPASVPLLGVAALGSWLVCGLAWGWTITTLEWEVGDLAWSAGLVVGGTICVARGHQTPIIAGALGVVGTLLAFGVSRSMLLSEGFSMRNGVSDLVFLLLAVATGAAVAAGGARAVR